MKNILSEANRGTLETFARSKVLLAFDYDGTLAPIVADPNEAAMRRETRRLLGRLTQRYPVVVISGRARQDACARLRGVAVREVIGNHGMEPWGSSPRESAAVRRWLAALEVRIGSLPGVDIEDKTYSIAVHYRRSRQKKETCAAILRAAARLDDARVIGGKYVVNVLPREAPHKGLALERQRARFGCETALYVGDDDTDEDVFALDRPDRLLGVRVGSRRTSAARYYIPTQLAIDDLLRALIDVIPSARREAP